VSTVEDCAATCAGKSSTGEKQCSHFSYTTNVGSLQVLDLQPFDRTSAGGSLKNKNSEPLETSNEKPYCFMVVHPRTANAGSDVCGKVSIGRSADEQRNSQEEDDSGAMSKVWMSVKKWWNGGSSGEASSFLPTPRSATYKARLVVPGRLSKSDMEEVSADLRKALEFANLEELKQLLADIVQQAIVKVQTGLQEQHKEEASGETSSDGSASKSDYNMGNDVVLNDEREVERLTHDEQIALAVKKVREKWLAVQQSKGYKLEGDGNKGDRVSRPAGCGN
jgi:hypothetical protein